MGTFIAKLKGNNEQFYKLVDHVENEDYGNIHYDEAMVYDANNEMANQWFKIEQFSLSDAFLLILSDDLDVAALESLDRDSYSNIDFIAFYDGIHYYIQKTTKSSYIKKKRLSFDGNTVNYQSEDSVIFISPIPNCIYNKDTDTLYFMDISKAYSVFNNLKSNYRNATDGEVVNFLSSDIVETSDFDVTKVGISNRKRIASILSIYNGYSVEQRNTLKNYIKDKVGVNIEYDEELNKFKIIDDRQLRLLLYGIQQRFYIPPLAEDGDVKVATNTTSISNLMG